MPLPDLVVFLGGMGGSRAEDMLGEALAEDALDTLEKVIGSGAVKRSFLITDRPDMAERCPSDVIVEVSAGSFHFGERLADVIRRHGLERLFCLGAGAAPFMTGEDFFSAGHYLSMAWNCVLTNNFHSSDVTGFVPAEALLTIELPERDNILPRLLRDQAGLVVEELTRNAATQFNVDTPSDLAILKLSGRAGPRLTRYLDGVDIDLSRYEACLPLLLSSDAEVVLAGRVGSHAWQYVEKEAACRTRLYSEERGMGAAGREHSGQARSLLGYHLQAVGSARFFEELAEVADAAFIDSRVALAHMGTRPSREDRFLSDLGLAEGISDPFLREFTESAIAAPIPVLLGGHSLVSGGLMALVEAAWDRQPEEVRSRRASLK